MTNFKQTLINLGFIVKMKDGKVIDKPINYDVFVKMEEHELNRGFSYRAENEAYNQAESFAYVPTWDEFVKIIENGNRGIAIRAAYELKYRDFTNQPLTPEMFGENGLFFLPEGHTIESICKYPTVREAVEAGIKLILK